MNLDICNASGKGVLYIGFNQDQSCFVYATDDGFKAYNTDPMEGFKQQRFEDGGIGHVEMLYFCNVIAFVGGGSRPLYPRNQVIVWDDAKKNVVTTLKLDTPVRAVRLRKDRLVAVLDEIIRVYPLTNNPKQLHMFETNHNSNGLCVLSQDENRAILAFPSRRTGQVQIVDLTNTERIPLIIAAHQNAISCMAISLDGQKLATASERGTIIRIFDTSNGSKVTEFRRGASQAKIYCINFNGLATSIVVSSNHGTIHVFNLQETSPSIFSRFFTSQLSEWKFAIPQGLPCLCAFGAEKNSVIAICADGRYYKFVFDSKGRSRTEICSQFLTMSYDNDM